MSEQNRSISAASFNQYLREGKLMATRCKDCRTHYLPPQAICLRCHGDHMEWVETSGKGKLVAFTAIGVGPSFMVQAGYGRDNPYVTGIVELQEGLKISARILGVDARKPETIHLGEPVTLALEKSGEGDASQAQLVFQVQANL